SDGWAGALREKGATMRARLKAVMVPVGLISLSFCAGVFVFYLPGRQYAAIPEVWLPTAQGERDEVLKLPVKTRPNSGKGVKFVSAYPDGPEIVEVHALKYKVKASDCPDLYRIKMLLSSDCPVIGKLQEATVYAIRRELPSRSMQAYMMRGETLVGISGVYSEEEALNYLRKFKKVARRQVGDLLASNRQQVDRVVEAIKAEKRANARKHAEAYRYLPFEPALPVALPAGWVQASVSIDGDDPRRPTGVTILYKKGPDRFIAYNMKPRAGFMLGLECGFTSVESASRLPCGPVPGEDYYSGGISGHDYAAWYLYRPIGDMVAILHVSVHAMNGQPLLFSNEDLEAQKLIAKSLRSAPTPRLKGVGFPGSAYDPYPYIKP
ncbi:MAG TPA: hypothetical protein VFM05_11160, partial [Candidatus Saccharimonadales bacterium]|nr:hypothetical protein [Candidatus Saccharimonadales bacterium]